MRARRGRLAARSRWRRRTLHRWVHRGIRGRPRGREFSHPAQGLPAVPGFLLEVPPFRRHFEKGPRRPAEACRGLPRPRRFPSPTPENSGSHAWKFSHPWPRNLTTVPENSLTPIQDFPLPRPRILIDLYPAPAIDVKRMLCRAGASGLHGGAGCASAQAAVCRAQAPCSSAAWQKKRLPSPYSISANMPRYLLYPW